MKKINWSLLLIILTISCNKEKEYDYPLINIGEVTNIDNTGAVFHANIKDESIEGIIDYGFVWSCNGVPDINSSQVKIVKPISLGVLSVKITNDLIPDTNYFVRAFARNSKYITYSSTVSFKSMGSSPPVIHSFSPDHGSAGTIVTLYGENFSGSILNNKIHFGNVSALIDSATNNKLVVKIDDNVTISGIVNIYIQVANHLTKSEKTFRLDGINIIDFTPKELKPTDTLYLSLENFDPNPTKNIVKIGNVTADNYSIRNNILSCTVPYNVQLGYNKISITSNNKTYYSENGLNILSHWSVIEEGNIFYRSGAIGFSINGKGYVGMGEDLNSSFYYVAYNDLYEFDPATSIWTKLANLPSNERQDAIGFAIGNKGYVGLGYNAGSDDFRDLWEYDPNLNSWVQKASFPGEVRRNPTCIVIGDKAYVGMGTYDKSLKDFWEYDPAVDEWRRLSDCPGNGGPYVGFCINNEGYFVFGYGSTYDTYSNAVWKYDPQINKWTRLKDFPGKSRGLPFSFSLNGYGYIGMGNNDGPELRDCWKYLSKQDKWIRISDISVKPRYNAKSFIIGNKAYITAGFKIEDWQFGTNAESLIIYQQ